MPLIVDYWPLWFRRLYGGEWPESYCAIDVETTGWEVDKDLITQWGHCLIKNGKIDNRLSLVIDWSNHDIVPDHWLRNRLASVRSGMVKNDKACHINYNLMQEVGMKPKRALEFIRDFTAELMGKDILMVAHGGFFDEKMIAANLIGFKIAEGFSFGDNGHLDTEAIEKASQCIDDLKMHPRKGDTLRTYFHRVKYAKKPGIKSSLDEHCHPKYNFAAKNISRQHMHDAGVDAYCCHLLMEEFRSQLTPRVLSLQDRSEYNDKMHNGHVNGHHNGQSNGQSNGTAPQARRVRGQRRT